MKKFLLFLMLSMSVNVSAKDILEDTYKYIFVSIDNTNQKEKIKIRVDDGIKNEKLKDEKGNPVVFSTKAGILMYFTSKGWEFINLYTSAIGAAGMTSTSGMMLFKKKCTPEELRQIVEQTIQK